MIWLYRPPIPVGRRGVFYSFKWFLYLPIAALIGRGGGVNILWSKRRLRILVMCTVSSTLQNIWWLKYSGWDIAECGWDTVELWMRNSRVVRTFGCQCQIGNSPGFNPSILRHSGIWWAADEAVLNNVPKKQKTKKSPLSILSWPSIYCLAL
jgi:hypothetical protein